MSRRRIAMEPLQELVRLHRMGTARREVARLVGMSPNTERDFRRALEAAGLLSGDPGAVPPLEELKAAVAVHRPGRPAPQQVSSMEKYREEIEKLWKNGAMPKPIHDALRMKHGADFSGSLSAIKRLCLRLKRERGVTAEEVVIPVETGPSEVAQVDFGYVGKLLDPLTRERRKAWVFVMVLGYSRHQYAEIVFDQRTETWLGLHDRAFAHFGGVPAVVVPDNLKAAVIRAAFSVDGGSGLNRSYRELARHYGFKVDPAPPRAPKKKGKVESGVKYVKRNYFKTLPTGEDRDCAQTGLLRWVTEIAGQRIHGTTRQRPIERFEAEERQHLIPLPAARFVPVEWKQATVHPDSHVVFQGRLYSVPWQHINQLVWVRATPDTVAVYRDDERIATHGRRGPGYRSTLETHLPEQRAAYRHRTAAYWIERADRIGVDAGEHIRAIFAADDVLLALRTVQAIVRTLDTVPPARANAACRRAAYYGSHTCRVIKNILRDGLDQQPLPAEPQQLGLFDPRYARTPDELCQTTKENDHASH